MLVERNSGVATMGDSGASFRGNPPMCDLYSCFALRSFLVATILTLGTQMSVGGVVTDQLFDVPTFLMLTAVIMSTRRCRRGS